MGKKFLIRMFLLILIVAGIVTLALHFAGRKNEDDKVVDITGSTEVITTKKDVVTTTREDIVTTVHEDITTTMVVDEPDDVNSEYSPKIDVPENVKAIYLTGWSAGLPSALDKFIEMANTTELNSVVIDVKDEDGYVGYKSDISYVNEIGSSMVKFSASTVLEKLHENNIYVIGRVVCFKDPVLSSKRPELAVKHISGGLWKDNFQLTWLDPYNRDSWSYLIEIAREALKKGFDEIQFDYIRFPNDGDKKAMVFLESEQPKYEIINEFLSYAKEELPGAVISADVFGIICESPQDTEDIGQYLEKIGMEIDFICPMVYPSHYARGQTVNGIVFDKPDLEPYSVVYNSLVKAKRRIDEVEGYNAGVRAYLQGFTATWLQQGNYITYGPSQIREQIKAVTDAGYSEWIIWDPRNKYPVEAFEKITQ